MKLLTQIKNYFSKNTKKEIFLYILTIIILSHFIKDIYIQYYFILFFTFLIVPIIFLYEKNYHKYFNNNLIFISFFIYLISTVLVLIVSIYYLNRFEMSQSQLLIALGKYYICPLMCIAFIILIDKINQIKNLLFLYSFFIFIASISIYIQEIYGHISFFGESYYHLPRYGKLGYSSITGSINSYGICFFIGIFVIYFLTKLNFFLKAILISIIIIAALLVTSKSGFINIGLTLLILAIHSFIIKKWKVFVCCLGLLILSIVYVDIIYVTFLTLLANVTGIEFLPNTLGFSSEVIIQSSPDRPLTSSGRIYFSLLELAYERLIYTEQFWPDYFNSTDYYFGVGVYGGAGAFGTDSVSTHNSYFDTFIIGGWFHILTQIFLILCVQVGLIYEILKKNIDLTLMLFFSNCLVLFNLLFFNGGFYQPVIMFSFWLSIAFLILKKIKSKLFY